MGKTNIWDAVSIHDAIKKTSTPEVRRVMEFLKSPAGSHAQNVIKSYNKLFPFRTEAGAERPPALQPLKRKPRGKNTSSATKAWQAKAEARLAEASVQWMERATERAKSRSEREAKRGKPPKLSKSALLEEAKKAGAPKDMTEHSRHFEAWRGSLPDEIVDRKDRNDRGRKRAR
jgi:hypothetical protein